MSSQIFLGIPVLNRLDLLVRCLDAVDVPADIVIVNNNTHCDRFDDELSALADRRGLTVWKPERNLGVAGSWNLLLRTGLGWGYDKLFLGSNDTFLFPGALRAVDERARAAPETEVIWHLHAWNFFLIDTRAVSRLGWFDENFYPAYKEDQDYAYRCDLAGLHRVAHGYPGGFGAEHLASQTIRSDREYQELNEVTHGEWNRPYYVRKWGGDHGEERFTTPFDRSDRDWRWWPDPGSTIRQRDWDLARRRERRVSSTPADDDEERGDRRSESPSSPVIESLYLAEPTRPLHEAWFAPMGLTLHLITDSEEILAVAETAFGGFGRSAPHAAADATFRLFTHEVDDEGPIGRPILRAEGGLVYQTAGRGATMVLDRAHGTAFGYFSPAALVNPVYFRWHFLDMALFFLVEEHGFLGVHGAALARGGRGLLLRAASGHGKSTLAYAAARQRFQAVADDIVWFAPDGLTLWGLPWTFHLLPDAAARFPELEGQKGRRQLNGESKIAVALESLRPGSTATHAEPAAIVLLRRSADKISRLTPAATAEVWDEWLSGAASQEPAAPDYVRRARALLDGLSLFRLEVGADFEAALDLLEPLLPKDAI